MKKKVTTLLTSNHVSSNLFGSHALVRSLNFFADVGLEFLLVLETGRKYCGRKEEVHRDAIELQLIAKGIGETCSAEA